MMPDSLLVANMHWTQLVHPSPGMHLYSSLILIRVVDSLGEKKVVSPCGDSFPASFRRTGYEPNPRLPVALRCRVLQWSLPVLELSRCMASKIRSPRMLQSSCNSGGSESLASEYAGDDENERDRSIRGRGVRSPEQEAADVLAAVDGLEPEYEFQSAEGGGTSSPTQAPAGDVSGSLDPQFGAGTSVEDGVPRVASAGGREPGRSQLNGVFGHPPSGQGAKGTGQRALQEWTYNAPRASQSADDGWWDSGAGASESERMGVLESLVQQLLKQNEYLKQELSDRGSRASGESAESGRVGPVQSAEQKSECRRAEGRGSGDTRESGSKTGKAVGNTSSREGPSFRVVQPPWTAFTSAGEASVSALPAVGPGDRFLAATRAMQNLSLEDFGPSSSVNRERGELMAWQASGAAEVAERPRSAGQVCNQQSGVSLTWQQPSGAIDWQQPGLSLDGVPQEPPQIHAEASEPAARVGAEAHAVGTVVKVVINGVPRRGVYNDRGEVELVPEQPKFYQMQDDDDDAFMTPSEPPPPPPPRPQSDVGELRAKCRSTNPFSVSASSPFRTAGGIAGFQSPIPPPPPPAPAGSSQVRVPSRSPGTHRSGSPRRQNRSLAASPPRVMCVNASPATPGGTRLPTAPPPESPLPRAPPLLGPMLEGLEEGDTRDLRPGERTLWELKVLGPVTLTDPNPAMRFSDWIHRVTPSFNDLAPRGHEWWQRVLQEARTEYEKWCKAKPLERSRLIGRPSQVLQGERFVRIEARGLAMLAKALPSALYEQALSVRSVTCTCLLFFAMRMYQPGGLTERSELLKGLTGLQVCDTAGAAVHTLQRWFRHLERARSTEISVPDSSLLLEGVDRCMKNLLIANPTLQFRVHSVRMDLQLDTSPNLDSVEQFTRTLLAEMELLAVSLPDSGSKRQRVAALHQGQGEEKGEERG